MIRPSISTSSRLKYEPLKRGAKALHVAVADDDVAARTSIASLLMRDLRTDLIAEIGNVTEIEDRISKSTELAALPIDAIIFDVEFQRSDTETFEILRRLHDCLPKTAVLCLSQYGDHNIIRQCLQAGARGFLLKNEINNSIPAAIVRASRNPFVFTSGWCNFDSVN